MYLHANAKLGLAGRFALVSAIEEGMSLKAAAVAFSVSPATAHRWWHRWREADETARATLSCLFDRSSRPHRSPRQLAPELEEAICSCRRQTGWGPRLVAGAPAFFAEHDVTATRLMTDNGFAYTKNRSLRDLLARHGIRHLTTEPYRPRTNGKVERFHQTMAREWAYGLAYRSHHQRNQALPYWLDHYNRRRPHSSLGDRPRSAAFTTSVGRTAKGVP